MINIFEVLSKTFDDYKNNFFKASVLCLIIYWFYERGFYIYSPLDFFAYTASGDSFFTLRFILSSIITLLLGSILIFGVYDYFLKISRNETYGFIMLRKNYNLTITGIFLMIGYFLTAAVFFFMMFVFSNGTALTGKNIYLNEYIKIINNHTSTQTIKIQSGAGGTDLTGPQILGPNGGFVDSFSLVGHYETATNTLLNLNLSGATSVGGHLVYVEV